MATKAIVVGGTSGIGLAMASRVAAEAGAASVIISGRTKPKDIPHPNMEFRPLDATSMHQIKKYTDAFKAVPNQKLDLLIMTQGIMIVSGRSETSEGIDRKMALHYYGRQLLIRELLPTLKEDGKVIIVYDGKFGNPDKLNWEDLDLKTHFTLGSSANHCMVMNDIMIQHFASQQQAQGTNRQHFVHAWPGTVNTNLLREFPRVLQPVLKVASHFITVAPETCADHLLDGVSARASEGEKKGIFWSNIDNKGRFIANKTVWNKDQIAKVVDHTWGLVDKGIQSSQQ